MKQIFSKIFWRILTFILMILILIAIWNYALGYWTFDDVLYYSIEIIKHLIPGILTLYILFKLFGERILYWFGRRKSAAINIDEIPGTVQVSGPKRKGKDASQTGAAIIMAEEFERRFRKELKTIKEKLYIYDFDKVDEYLEKYGTNFFVASDMRVKKVFKQMIYKNNCFILPYWIKKGMDPLEHYRTWNNFKDKRVPDIPFQDGLTPGGKHMLDMLLRYCKVYMRVNHISNYIMSNQPIIEKYKVEKTGEVQLTFSKIFSQDFLKLKKETPMPFPMGGIGLETETAIFYPNTDKNQENFIKNESGIRETHTTSGHLTREEFCLRGITQSKTRTNLSLRELYEGYIHVFGLQFKATSDYARFNYKILRLILKLNYFILTIRIRSNLIKFNKTRLRHRQYKIRKRISKLHQKDLEKWSKGYIIFKLGIYDNIEDCGKRVRYPLFYGIKDSSNASSPYRMLGFKQVVKIKDSFGRYDTWYMYSVREAKEQLINVHFNDVPTWESRGMKGHEMNYLGYGVMDQMLTVPLEIEKRFQEELKKRKNKFAQSLKTPVLPNLLPLSTNELLILCEDFGIDTEQFDMASTSYRADIIKTLSIEFKSMRQKKRRT